MTTNKHETQQGLSENNTVTDYARSLLEEEMTKLRKDITLIIFDGVKKQQDVFRSQMNEFELSRLMHEASIFRLNKNLKNPNSYNSRRAAELGVEGEIPFDGEMTDAQEELLNEYIGEGGNPYRGQNWVPFKDAQEKVYEYLVGSEVSWLPEDTKKYSSSFSSETSLASSRASWAGSSTNSISNSSGSPLARLISASISSRICSFSAISITLHMQRHQRHLARSM